jgi:predicted amidohydrolase
MEIRIVQIRVYPVSRDLEANYRRLEEILKDVAVHHPDVVITPEGFLDGYVAKDEQVNREDMDRYAIYPERSDYAQAISRWAAQHSTWFVFGCTRAAIGGVYNSALIYDRKGDLVGIYDKTHLQTHDHKYLPGQSLPVFSADFGVFGVMICADRRWPETVRTLALKGARVIFNPTYGFHSELNQRMMQTRSYESEVFIVFTHPTQSLVTAPNGEIVIDDRSEDTTFAVSDINLSDADAARAGEQSHLRYRRTDLYL